MINRTTPVPNHILDVYLPILKPTEVALLLVIIRQTAGWIDKLSKKRKYKDRLSGSQLQKKTGYSRKSISTAIQTLLDYKLIKVFNASGEELGSTQDRKGKYHLYFAFNPQPPLVIPSCVPKTNVNSTQLLRTFYAQQKKLIQKKYSLQTF